MNSENSKTNESNRFKYNFTNKLNLKNPNTNIALANLSIIIHGKILNLNIKTVNLKFMHLLGMKYLIYQMEVIKLVTYKIILDLSLKKHETITDENSPIKN